MNVHVPHAPVLSSSSSPPFVHTNNLPPRLEWDQNFGYCGETSFISAGLFYGQYCSQYTARSLASPGIPQYQQGSQLLIGINDQTAAEAMHLNTIEWDSDTETSTDDFLAWVKQNILLGYPVVFGIFNNEYLLYGVSDPESGDEDYDHIVVGYGIGSNHPLSDTGYYPDDTIYFSDNGLWAAFRNPPYLFSYPFLPFQANREEANNPAGSIYSLNDAVTNYGVALTGVTDLDGNTIPVRLTTNINYEIPEILQGQGRDFPPPGANAPPQPIPLTLTIVVTIPDTSVSYNLYYYNDFSDVPNSNFNANAGAAYQVFHIPADSGSTYTMSLDIQSNEVAAFRAVRSSAP